MKALLYIIVIVGFAACISKHDKTMTETFAATIDSLENNCVNDQISFFNDIHNIAKKTDSLTAALDSLTKAHNYFIIEKHKQEVYELLKAEYYNTVANQSNLDSCFQDGYLTALEDLGYIIERW